MALTERKKERVESTVKERMEEFYEKECRGNVNQRLNLQAWVVSEIARLEGEIEQLNHRVSSNV